jgi:hypothetical protein
MYNKKRGLPLLGANARNEYAFGTPEDFHDVPIQVSETNKLYFPQLSPNLLSQIVINLTAFPPTLSYKTAKPPLTPSKVEFSTMV